MWRGGAARRGRPHSSIDGQTNFLARIATIEATRAGEAGRGFAGVAAEVTEPANDTARATEEISQQIGGIQGVTDQAVAAIGGIVARTRDIDTVAAGIAAAAQRQGAATWEVVRNVAQASAGTSEVTDNITGVAGVAEETGAARQVLATAATVPSTVEKLLSQIVFHRGSSIGSIMTNLRKEGMVKPWPLHLPCSIRGSHVLHLYHRFFKRPRHFNVDHDRLCDRCVC